MPTPNAEQLRADSARVRARMLAAARDRVSAGDLELPMNAVAKAAGVGVGTMYRHFPTRQTLLESLAAENLRSLVAGAEAAAADPDVTAGLSAMLRAGVRLQLTDPALAEVLAATEAARAETLSLSRELADALARLLDRARAAGAIRSDVTADDLRRLVCGTQHAIRIGDPADADRYLDILLHGLLLHGPRPGPGGQKRAGSR